MRTPLIALGIAAALLASAVAAQTALPAHRPADDFVAAAPAEHPPAPIAPALTAIRADALAARIAFLASPALQGRGLGTRGLDAAAEYVASALALAGIPPLAANEGAPQHERYFQPVPLREITEPGGEVVVETHTGDRTWSRVFSVGADGVLPEVAPQTLRAPVAFAGYGIREAALGRDDYRGLELRGNVALVLGGLPPGRQWQADEMRSRYAGKEREERWRAKLAAARAAGAAAVLAIEENPPAPADDPPAGRFFLPFDVPSPGEAPLVRVSPAVADALLAAAGLDMTSARTATPRELPGTSVTIRVSGHEHVVNSRNVVGMLAGSDPRLREEAVVLGAHIDHLGSTGDVFYPGADDNASGTAALIEIAKAFATLPARPKRTVVFAFWTGEEEGKLGSGYFVRHPRWPLGRIAAYLNLDMIGHPWRAEEIAKLVAEAGLPDGPTFLAHVTPADFAEPGLPVDAPAIAAALRVAAHVTGMALHLDHTDGLNGGSDYRDFARAGVPFVRFFGNFFPAYHEPGDTAETLDAGQVERMARLAFVTAWLLAEYPPA
jgi:hypothetical protein